MNRGLITFGQSSTVTQRISTALTIKKNMLLKCDKILCTRQTWENKKWFDKSHTSE